MPRIKPLTFDEAPAEVRAILEMAGGRPQMAPSGGIQAYCPPIFEASRNLGAAPARSGKLPPLIRSMACLRAAQIAGCPF